MVHLATIAPRIPPPICGFASDSLAFLPVIPLVYVSYSVALGSIEPWDRAPEAEKIWTRAVDSKTCLKTWQKNSDCCIKLWKVSVPRGGLWGLWDQC